MSNTRDVTAYLRAFALLTVVVGHFVNRYVSLNYTGYGNGFIAIFFVLSGYGLFHSMSNTFSTEGGYLHKALRFYYSRALRIFPLYWIFLLIYSYTYGAVPSLWIWLGIPIKLAPGVGWFMTLLIQCYLLAPLLYMAIRKLGVTRYVILIISAVFIIYILSLTTEVTAHKIVYSYRHMFLGHIFLFSLGLAIPYLVSLRSGLRVSRMLLPISFLIFSVMVHYTRGQYPEVADYIAPFCVLSAFSFCFLMILTKPRLILGRLLILLGTYSYSIYLFHLSFFDGLEALGALNQGPIQGVGFVLLFFPYFLVACILIENLANKIRIRFERSSP